MKFVEMIYVLSKTNFSLSLFAVVGKKKKTEETKRILKSYIKCVTQRGKSVVPTSLK